MVIMGTKPTLLLVQLVVVAALVMAAAQAITVTIYNPGGMVVNVVVDDNNIQVTTEVVTVNTTLPDLQISVADGNVADVNVHDGDVIVLIPDPSNPQNVQVFKVLVNGDSTFTLPKPSAAPIKPSATLKPPSVP